MIQPTNKPATATSDASHNLAEIVDEITERLGRGEVPDLDKYAKDDPRLHSELQRK